MVCAADRRRRTMVSVGPVPRSIAVLSAGLTGVHAGCGGDDASSTATSSAPAGAIAGPAAEAESLPAYEPHWAPFYEFINNLGSGNIGDYIAGHRRDDLPRQVANIAGQGLRGEPDLSPGPVTADGRGPQLHPLILSQRRRTGAAAGTGPAGAVEHATRVRRCRRMT